MKLGLPVEIVLKIKIIYDILFNKNREYMESFHNRWGDLWKEYYRKNYDTIAEKTKKLKNGMNEESRQLVDTIFERNVFLLPWQKNNKTFLYNIKQAFSAEELQARKIFRKKLRTARKKYRLAADLYDESTFCTKCGFDFLPDKIEESINNKDILDIGAFIGDSALVFNEYSPHKIYSFEPDPNNFALLEKTIAINKLEDKVVSINKGIAEREGNLILHTDLAASTVYNADNKQNGTEIDVITIDSFVAENRLDIGLIKMDIEGAELNAVKGAIETIKKFQPILLIAVYHTPQDFFEIKPLIENIAPNYRFILKKLTPYHPTYETTLIAYPKIE